MSLGDKVTEEEEEDRQPPIRSLSMLLLSSVALITPNLLSGEFQVNLKTEALALRADLQAYKAEPASRRMIVRFYVGWFLWKTYAVLGVSWGYFVAS